MTTLFMIPLTIESGLIAGIAICVVLRGLRFATAACVLPGSDRAAVRCAILKIRHF